jgi:predicted deacetylase
MTPRLCIALHDVAPATWPQCTVLLDLLAELRCTAITLLVVPDYHGRGRIADAPRIVRAIDRHVERGAEIALHGYFHLDNEPWPRRPVDWLRRRVLTAGEGEFAALSVATAANRIERGLREFAGLGWPVRGFVAPAWLASSGTWQALRATPLAYTATHGALFALDGMRRIPAPALTISTRSRWRRTASRAWLRGMRIALRTRPLLRLALHPADAEHPQALRDWRWLAGLLLEEREAVTKSQAVAVS